ncbi:MAG: hypothetical protein AAFP85_19865, partial [Pseudomonadota bacterium]
MNTGNKARSLKSTLLLAALCTPMVAFMLFYLTNFVASHHFVSERRYEIFVGYLVLGSFEIFRSWRNNR